MPLVLCFAGILCLILLIVWSKLDTFISFVVVSIGLGLASGLNVHQISGAIQAGIANILGSLVLILGFGAMLGKLVADSGAAQQITHSLIRMSGLKHIQVAMALAGLLVGIPMFYNAGFVVVVPFIFAVGASTELPLLYIGIPMLSALSVAHGFLPPHPSPTAIAEALHASLGKTLVYGLGATVPAIILAGIWFGRTLKRYKPVPDPTLLTVRMLEKDQLPGLGVSLTAALLPLILLTVTTVADAIWPKGAGPESVARKVVDFVGEPNIAMLVSVLAAIYLLGIRRGKPMPAIMRSLEDAFKGVAPVMLIIAGSGVFMEVMKEAGVNEYVAKALTNASVGPLVLGWGIAALIRVCLGSATVAGLTAVTILAPLLHQTGMRPELMVISIGAGSLFFSHVNDGGFWLFKQYFNLTIRQTLATWSVMETIVSVVGLGTVLLINYCNI